MGNQINAVTIPRGNLDLQMVPLEMLNILVALTAWGAQWSNKRISIACDNEAIVYVLDSGKARDLTLAAKARNFQFEMGIYKIDLRVVHIPGEKKQYYC